MTGTNQPCTQTLRCNINIQNILSAHERELYEMAQICGISIDQKVFRILLELLQLDISPAAVFTMLQTMAGQAAKASSNVSKKTAHSKVGNLQVTGKKKPPIAAKPKKVSNFDK